MGMCAGPSSTKSIWEQWYTHNNKHNYHLHFDFEIEFSTKKSRPTWVKWLLLGLGQGKHKMILEHFVMLGSKELLLEWWWCQKDREILLKVSPLAKLGVILIIQINNDKIRL